jgi:hypothetical protein
MKRSSPYGARYPAQAAVKFPRVREPQKAKPEPVRYSVRGKRATSYEANVALALDKFGIEYLFQVDYWGGRSLAGGMVLDFLVFTDPLPTPLYIQGGYWHQGQRKTIDSFQAAELGHLFHGQLRPALFWYDQDTETPEAAERAVKRDIL